MSVFSGHLRISGDTSLDVRCWLGPNGPLRTVDVGGADIYITGTEDDLRRLACALNEAADWQVEAEDVAEFLERVG